MRARLLDIRDRMRSGQLEGLHSPSFLMPPPVVRHRDRIPADVLERMAPTWERTWYPSRPLQVSVFENVFVAQEGLVLHPDGCVVDETIQQHSTAAIDTARRWVLESRPHTVREIPGNVVLCRKPGCHVYGHWLVELLPKAWLASQLPQRNTYMIQSAHGRIATIMRDTLASLGIAGDAIVEAGPEPVWVERLVHIHGLSSHGTYMSPLAVACLQAIAECVQPGPAGPVFVTRGPAQERRLVDEARLAACARKAGFRVVEPGAMSFTDQVSTFKGATRIVGVMGSALANLAFVQPGTEACVLAPDNMPDTFFWFLSHHTGASMVDIRCRTARTEGIASYDAPLTLNQEDADILGSSALLKVPGPGTLFDPAFYAHKNEDVARAGIDPLDHYMAYGWMEGRRPSAAFDGTAYLAAHPDVRAAGLNPLLHYLRHGHMEGRARL